MNVIRAGLLLAAVASTSNGAVRFTTDEDVYSVLPGASFSVNLYLEFDGVDAAKLITEQGLYGVGFRAAIEAPAAGFSLNAGSPLIANDLDFDDSFGPTIQFDGSADVGVLLLADPFEDDGDAGVLGVEVAPGVRRITLGELSVRAPSDFNVSATISIADFNSATDDTVTWTSLQTIDPDIQFAAFTISTVPSPSTVPVVVAVLGVWRRRTRR